MIRRAVLALVAVAALSGCYGVPAIVTPPAVDDPPPAPVLPPAQTPEPIPNVIAYPNVPAAGTAIACHPITPDPADLADWIANGVAVDVAAVNPAAGGLPSGTVLQCEQVAP
jgi:hypothetical protein